MSGTNYPLIKEQSIPAGCNLIEQMVERDNMILSLKRVMQNKGAPGLDGLSVSDLPEYLRNRWQYIKEQLLGGKYIPMPVLRVDIPKPDGGMRKPGVPTVLDRLIQQAMSLVLIPLVDPHFSASSYGFRPGKSAHQAVLQAKSYQHEGKRWVVDMDLAKFFDEVNHDILMSRVGRKVKDRKMLYLIRQYLQSGVMHGGVVSRAVKGTPQGGPLSPLLSNIMLDDLDKELEQRGHCFCRYADDCNIYVSSRRSGERVLASVSRYIEGKLKLKVNREKSAVGRPWDRKFLGYSFTFHKRCKVRVAPKSLKRFRAHLKRVFRMGRGRNLRRFIVEDLNPILRGWINYFILAETKGFAEDLDKWIRRKLRLILWRQWKRPWTRFKKLRQLGIPEERATMSAFNGHGPWFNSGSSHMNEAIRKKHFDNAGLFSLLEQLHQCRAKLI